MPLTILPGDIFTSRAQTLVNPVNCQGAMGKGLARAFAIRYPAMFTAYRAYCVAGELRPGILHLYTASSPWILNFPTKVHWRHLSRLPYIVVGLEAFVAGYAGWGITSVALPALGCGLGGLAWSEVAPLLRQYLDQLPIAVEVYTDGIATTGPHRAP
jgi:O-acetyl-ADP-ribose deacetylase (regulator of RNase III)